MLVITFYTEHIIVLPNLIFGYILVVLNNYFYGCTFIY